MQLDARWPQIVTLSLLLGLEVGIFDFGPSWPQIAVIFGSIFVAQALAATMARVPFDWRSPLITGCSLCLLLRSHEPAIWLLAGLLAVLSKFCLRVRGKHLFNPANFAIVALLLCSRSVWVSPGQWGSALWLATLLLGLGGLVLGRVRRIDAAIGFLVCYGGLLLARCLYLGDPLTIPWHQMQSGALLIFALFMLTDPRSTPDRRAGRLLLGLVVALIAYHLQFVEQKRASLFYALALASLLTPAIDFLWPAPRFQWQISREAT